MSDMASQVSTQLPAIQQGIENLNTSGADANAITLLTDIERALARIRLEIPKTAADVENMALALAADSNLIDEGLLSLVNGNPGQGLLSVGGEFRQGLIRPVDGLIALWEPAFIDIESMVSHGEELTGGLEAAQAIVFNVEPMLREISVVVGLFDEESRDKIDQVQWFLVAVTGVFLYICALAMWVTWRTIRPLDRLTRAASHIADGDLTARVEVSSRDEIGMLAEAFNRMSEDLQKRDVEIAAVNDELEAFNYSVSHDLRAPLRTIDGFSQALLEDYEDKLDDEGKDYLGRTRAASQRMGILIDDLLNLSRVTRGELRHEEVDLTNIARQVIKELEDGDSGRKVNFELAEGAVTMGDPSLLRAVLDNLIGNAWKFTGKHETAKIEFGVVENEGRPAFFVRDDGAGFDMNYAGNLFGAFQRLHGMTEFPGTGIGLATVQRIIHRHGGRVWAESEIEKGATFYFTVG